MHPLPPLKILLNRLKRKSLSQILRFVFMRTPILSILGSYYYHLKFRTKYYDYINRTASRIYKADQNNPSLYAKKAASIINADGVYTDSIENIGNHKNILNDLANDAGSLLQPILNKQIGENGSRASRIMGIGRDVRHACLPYSFATFFLSDAVLDIVNACHGKLSRLNYVDTWHNVPATGEAVNYTEVWHRDHEDIKIIKVFVYLSDVDETMGPFSYLKGTQYGGRVGYINPANPPCGVAIDDRQLAKIISLDRNSLQICTGKAGTIIISNTSGVHKGGRTTSEPRTVAVAAYTSDAGVDPHFYRLPDSINQETLSFAAKYAMHMEPSYELQMDDIWISPKP